MAKKRKAGRRPAAPSGPRELDPADAKLRINSYEDVADSEEEYYMNKDRIDFDDEPKSKRQRRLEEEDEFLELSDEEVLGDSEDDSDEDENEEDVPRPKSKRTAARRAGGDDLEDGDGDEEEQAGEEGEDSGWWGSSRKEYYDADQIETEADALEEEAEARKLQQKKLAKMDEADFLFDEQQWLAHTGGEDTEAGDVVTEALRDAQITEDMTPKERYKLLQARYPEFDYLADEFTTLQPLLAACQKETQGRPSKSLEVVKYRILGAYVASLAGYFAILASPARDGGDGAQKSLDPAELRDHDVMETLVECREAWLKVNNFKASKAPLTTETGMLSPPEEKEAQLRAAVVETAEQMTTKDKLVLKETKAQKKKAAEKARQERAIEDSLADLSDLLKKPEKRQSKSSAATNNHESRPHPDGDDRDSEGGRSDFGEEDTIDARTAADKAQRKKSLRFYTSQIVQKSNRRAGAGRDAGGDTDIPYRERLKDRQARLLAEAERRGNKDSKHGADLGEDGGSDGGESDVGGGVRDQDDEYYDMVSAAARRKKEDKAARQEAIAAAKKGERVVEKAEVGEDGKRKVTYAIEKNKGLAPKRKNELRNPRVKKRLRYAEKQKKLKSMRPVYQGGEGRGGYQGELSGIQTGLVKSIKF